uniref:Centrosomal protein 95 n=2 Tax=Callorhinchus milii TaxID=7868 RepID=A0A4W3JZC9_CALMI
MQIQGRSATFVTPRNLSTRPNALQLGEPIRSAIPLQSPYRLAEHRTAAEAPTLPEPRQQRESPTSMVSHSNQPSSHRGSPRLAGRQNADTSTVCNFLERSANVPANGIPSRLSPDLMQEGSQQDYESAVHEIERQQVIRSPTRNATKRVAFQIEPDIKFMTAQSNAERCDAEEGRSIDQYKVSRTLGSERSFRSDPETSLLDHNHHIDAFENTPLSHRRAKNLLAEQELHEFSEKLSRRLNQLDLILKQALGEKYEASNLKDEDKLSQHSDSITEYRRVQRLPVTPHLKKPSRARSLSPSPPRSSVRAECEDAVNGETSGGQLRRIHKDLQQELDLQKMKVKMVSQLYMEELEDYKTKERSQLSEEKEKAKKTEREYKENIFKEALRTPHARRVYCAKGMPRKPKHNQWSPGGAVTPRKATPMKIKDNDLLPLLLDEFPYLQISPHTMNRMWKQQFRQIEQLTRSTGEQNRTQTKLQSEIEDAQRKHDLLVQIIKKEREHNQRLKDFKERVQQQKFAQNKVKEQRQQVARAKKYYSDYHVQLRAKMMRAKTREERVFKNLFEEGLELQKHRLHELKMYAKEKREEQKKRQREELESMENYYKDQFLMLAETVAQERHKVQIRETAQTKALQKMKKELRVKMEKEIRELQAMITQDDDDAYFRELEAERQQRRVQMASFQFSKTQSF